MHAADAGWLPSHVDVLYSLAIKCFFTPRMGRLNRSSPRGLEASAPKTCGEGGGGYQLSAAFEELLA